METKENIKMINKLELNPKGTHMSFLKRFPAMEKYCESVEIAAEISRINLSIFISVQDKLDLDNSGDRLGIAVHYLSLPS